jgi:ribonuclease HI
VSGSSGAAGASLITAAADGSSLSNPGPAGWAWYIDEGRWAAGGWPHGTNNMAELMAVLDLLRQTRGRTERLRILCDSQYAINVCTTWLPAWKRRGWRKADNKPILNLDLVQALDAELAGRPVSFDWVKGHAGHLLNEAADERARAAAEAYRSGWRPAAGPGFDPPPVPVGSGQTSPGPAAPAITGPAADHQLSLFNEADPGHSLTPDDAAPTVERHSSLSRATNSGHLPTPTGAATSAEHQLQLFSATDSDRLPTPADPAVAVADRQRQLFNDATWLDRGRLADLLHPSFVSHGPGGAVRTRGAVLARPAPLSGAARFDILGADDLAADVVALRYRLHQGGAAFLGYTVWQRAGGHWQARFQQLTPTG